MKYEFLHSACVCGLIENLIAKGRENGSWIFDDQLKQSYANFNAYERFVKLSWRNVLSRKFPSLSPNKTINFHTKVRSSCTKWKWFKIDLSSWAHDPHYEKYRRQNEENEKIIPHGICFVYEWYGDYLLYQRTASYEIVMNLRYFSDAPNQREIPLFPWNQIGVWGRLGNQKPQQLCIHGSHCVLSNGVFWWTVLNTLWWRRQQWQCWKMFEIFFSHSSQIFFMCCSAVAFIPIPQSIDHRMKPYDMKWMNKLLFVYVLFGRKYCTIKKFMTW